MMQMHLPLIFHPFIKQTPVLGVCYGAQLTVKEFGGKVEKSNKREFGRAKLHKQQNDVLLMMLRKVRRFG